MGPRPMTAAAQPLHAWQMAGGPLGEKDEGGNGGSCRIRTCDQRIKSPLLYQLS